MKISLLRYILAFIILAGAVGRASAVDDRYYALADSADTAISIGQWTAAERYLLNALRLEPAAPGNVMLMSNLAYVQMRREEPDQAIATITQALAAVPDAPTLLNMRARIYAAEGRDSLAMADYSRMLEINPDSETALFGRGMIALAHADLASAEPDLDRLAALAPESRDNHVAQATMRALKNDYAESETHYTALIDEHPTDEYYLGRAVSRIMQGKLSEANEDLAEGLRLNPNNADILAQLAYLSKLTYRMADYDVYIKAARKLGYED